MLFAVIAKSGGGGGGGGESSRELSDDHVQRDNGKTSISVYTSENHGTTIEIPLTPESTVADILDCVTDPVRGSGYLVAVTDDTEYILQAADNAFSFVHESWASTGSPLTFVLRYMESESPWPPLDLEARRHQMRRPSLPSQTPAVPLDYYTQTSKQYRNYSNYPLSEGRGQPMTSASTITATAAATAAITTASTSKLPGGPGDLTLAELQEMATRQQQQMESQQQVLVAKEQRLKYLKQQEARHAQLASESERLRKIRERVESQELKLKKLRALRGQAEQYRSNNGQLNSELDAVRAVFNEKEKELTMAVARVDQLTRQLSDIRNGKTNTGLSGQKHAAAALELEKLRKELLLRNKLNEQQTNNISAKEKVLHQKREEMKNMDNRILELQQRLKKRKQQEDQNRQAANKQNKENANSINSQVNSVNTIKTGDPYIQYAPNDVVKDDSYSQHGHFVKQDPKYQTLPAGARLTQPNVDVKGSKPPHHNHQYDNRDTQGDYNLPVVLPLGHGSSNINQNKQGYNHNTTSQQHQQQQQQQRRQPPPPQPNQQQQSELINPPPPSHNKNNKPQPFNNNDFTKPNQNFTNLPTSQPPPPTSQHQQQHQHHHPPTPTQRQQPPPHHLQNNQTNRLYPGGPNTTRTSSTSGVRDPPSQGKEGVGVSGLPTSSLHPVISIHEEERQAGSGQSSPASSEGFSNSSGGIITKQDESNINQSPLGPVSAMIERLNSNKGNNNHSTTSSSSLQSKDGAKSTSDLSPSAYAPPPSHFQTPSSSSSNGQAAHHHHLNSQQTKAAFEGVSTFLASNNKPAISPSGYPHQPEDGNSPRLGSSGELKTSSNQYPNSNNAASSAQPSPPPTSHPGGGQHPHLNLKPAPTYRYASKNQIANTYMGRLGGAAMEKYQQNLNKLYKNLEAQDAKTRPGGVAGGAGADPMQEAPGVAAPGQEGEGQQTFGAVSPHDYPDIASDKGSYKLNTPKQVRRRHSDGESDEVNKALQDRQELEAKEQQQGDATASKASKDLEKTVANKSAVPENEKNQKANAISASKGSESLSVSTPPASSSSPSSSIPTTPSATTTTSTTTPRTSSSSSSESVSKPSSDSKDPSSTNNNNNKPPSKAETVVKKTRSNLKKVRGVRRCNNRVSFDPLALLLDGSLEGELDLVKKVAVQVDDVSTPNDEGITALHNAICAGHYEIVKFLIEFGCDVNSPDSDGWTPLHCAASCNNLPMVRFLVEHGACVFATTISDQETAADKCEEDEDGYDGCSDYLYSIQEKLGITNGGDVYAVFDYTASSSDELTFVINDRIAVLRKGDETEKEWWWAQLNGKEGYIPRNLLGLYARVLQQPSEVSEC